MATEKRNDQQKTDEEPQQQCQDCLIWIGSRYYGTVAKYVKEAETRGCCRRIPSWPTWATPGKTRVFLAHRDTFKRRDKGAIFGYFVLHGVDIILTQQDCDKYEGLKTRCGGMLSSKQEPGSSKNVAKTAEVRKRLEPLVGFWNQRLRKLPFNTAPKPDEKPAGPHSELGDDVIDFLLEFLLDCGPKFDRDSLFGYGISTHQTSLEEGRLCGIRTDPDESKQNIPSVYLVDTLTRTIDERFCELLKELIKNAIGREQKRKVKGRRFPEKEVRDNYTEELRVIASERIAGSTRQKGIPDFKAAVKEALKVAGDPAIPKDVRAIAEPHGSLVLFDKPYPTFQKAPRAAFLGLLRIDGDQLMSQILNIYKKGSGSRELAKLPYCEKTPDSRTTPETELIRKLAQALRINKQLAGRIMDEFADLIAGELRERDAIRLNRIGTFRIKAKNGRRLVKFKVSQSLRSGVTALPGVAAPKTARKRNKVTKDSSTESTSERSRRTGSATKRTK